MLIGSFYSFWRHVCNWYCIKNPWILFLKQNYKHYHKRHMHTSNFTIRHVSVIRMNESNKLNSRSTFYFTIHWFKHMMTSIFIEQVYIFDKGPSEIRPQVLGYIALLKTHWWHSVFSIFDRVVNSLTHSPFPFYIVLYWSKC